MRDKYDRTQETTTEELKQAVHLQYSEALMDIQDCQIFIVTVPTPIDKNKRPDLTPLIKASETVGKVLKKAISWFMNQPFTLAQRKKTVCRWWKTQRTKIQYRLLLWLLSWTHQPGRQSAYRYKNIKSTSGSTPEIAEEVDQLYKSIIVAGTYKASSIRVAEAAKVIETLSAISTLPCEWTSSNFQRMASTPTKCWKLPARNGISYHLSQDWLVATVSV